MKTPDEFLHHHYIHDNGLENTPEYIFNAMKSFADQEKQALKEKIIKSCNEAIDMEMESVGTEFQVVEAYKNVIEFIESL